MIEESIVIRSDSLDDFSEELGYDSRIIHLMVYFNVEKEDDSFDHAFGTERRYSFNAVNIKVYSTAETIVEWKRHVLSASDQERVNKICQNYVDSNYHKYING